MTDESAVAFAGAAGQAALLANGALTSVELVELLLTRIARLDPTLNAFRVVLTDSARQQARTADAARRDGDSRPLLGVPIAIKDNVAVAGQQAMSGTGSPEPIATEDDELVRRIRAAGLIPLGLTQLPELALWAATESAHHGVTRNPWDPARAPGGSSGGSAVAVAAGLVAAAHGTDGLGSIRLPAAACGLVGLKPTHGLVPLGPDIDHWEGLSHAGFLTRTVEDTALLLDAVAGPLPPADAAPLRIAVSTRPATPTRVDPALRAAVDTTATILRDLGHELVPADPPYRQVSTATTLRYLAGVAHDVDALTDPRATERRTRVLAALGHRLPRRAVNWSRGRGAAFAERMAAFFGEFDLLLTPTTPFLPARAGGIVGRGLVPTIAAMAPRAAFTGAWNACGLPAMNLPVSMTDDGLPAGVQLVGPRNADARLLAVASDVERAVGWPARRPPESDTP